MMRMSSSVTGCSAPSRSIQVALLSSDAVYKRGDRLRLFGRVVLVAGMGDRQVTQARSRSPVPPP